MNMHFSWLGATAIAVATSVASASFRHNTAEPSHAAAAPCAADSNYQRLAFWVGDWTVYDSTGKRYATQRVRAVVDACAITADWTGNVGDRGLSMSAFDRRSGEWKQVYVSNQVPYPSGVPIRHSDSTYRGPGIRFIPLLEPTDGSLTRSRVTIMPWNDNNALQLFEDSPDGGKTWHTVFKAEHRPERGAER
jgi:hypothetical protein